jgi:uncharacterized protein YjdB
MRHPVSSIHRSTRRPVTYVVARLALAAVLLGGSACQIFTGPRTEKIELTLPNPTLAVGQTMTATAQPQKKDGTPRDRKYSLRSSDNTIATVTANGLITGVSVGTVTITATSDGKSDQETLTVVAAVPNEIRLSPQFGTVRVGGAPLRLTATALDGLGRPLAGGTVRWESGNSAIATVSSDGTVTGLTPGQVNIIADISGRQGTATISVTLLPLQSVDITPNPFSIEVRETRPLTITARDTAGRVTPTTGRGMQFAVSDQTVASVSNTGIVTGLKEGTAIITANIDGVRRDVTVNVVPQKVAAVVFNTARTLTLRRTATNLLQAIGLDSTTNPIPGLVLSYRSSNPGVVSVLPNSGLVTSNSLGTAYIVASAGGRADSVFVTVTEIPIGQVAVTPVQPTITGGSTQQFSATVRDSAGTIVTGRQITWFTSNAQVLSINAATGLASALALNGGTAQIVASVERVAGQAELVQGGSNVSILPAPVASLAIVPNPIDIRLGSTRTLVVVAKDARGNELLQRSFTITSANTNVVQVSNGQITAVGAGTTTITAQAVNSVNQQPDGPPATATVNVVAGVAASRAPAARSTP